MAEPTITVEKFSELVGKGCPVCNRGIEVAQVVVPCPRCKSPHHEDCWYNAGGCGKRGCRGVASARPATTQTALAEAARAKTAGASAGGDAAPAQAAPQTQGQGQLPVGTVVGAIVVLVILAAFFLLRR